MASSGKKKTTFAKLARESRLRERRLDKAARKDTRRRAAELTPMAEMSYGEDGEMLDGEPVDGEAGEGAEGEASRGEATAAPVGEPESGEPDQA